MTRTPLATLIAVVLAAGCGRSTPGSDTEAAPIPVATAPAAITDVTSSFEAGGVVRARVTAAVASRVMAPIVAVHVRPGARVRRGDLLVTLDARELDANRRRAAAALASALQATTAADSDVHAAEAGAALARVSFDRTRRLADQRSATAQELDQAKSAADAADAQLAGNRARAAAAAAARDAARETLDAASVASSYAVLVAPFDGVVTDRSADPGVMAVPGSTLLTIEDVSALRLEVRLDEARASHVRLGDIAEIRCDLDSADGDPHWTRARVGEIARVDPAAHSFVVKLDLPDPAGLQSGQFAPARFSGAPRRALTVPTSALRRRGQLAFVFVVDSGDRARLQPVSPGPAAGDRTEILAGVRDGERLVLNPPAALSDRGRITGNTR